jgi:hypothetical protein
VNISNVQELAEITRRRVLEEVQNRVMAHQSLLTLTPDATRPLTLLADGDSWFDYPLDGAIPGIHTDVIAALPNQCKFAVHILNLAHYGFTSTQEMGYAKQKKIHEVLSNTDNGKFDGILFSGGGNDIVGDALCIWLNDAKDVGGDYDRALDTVRLDGVIESVRSNYLDLIALRDEVLPGAPIFTHSYDLPVVSGVGVACLLGPWLKPSLDFCGWTDPVKGAGVIHEIMQKFDGMLLELSLEPTNNLVHVQTQGTLMSGEWANELHPTPDGFKKIAAKFATAIGTYFKC